MDIEKVLSVFKELIKEEEEFNVQKILNNLLSHITSGASTEVDAILAEINTYAQESILNEYAYSKLKLLDKIEARNYFGFELKAKIKNILNKEVYKVKDNLSSLITKRNTFIADIKANIANLEKLEFESYYDTIEDFELGLIIPEEESDLKKVQIYLKDWHFILKHLSELCDGDHAEPRIYSVSNNSIGIFTVGNIAVIFGILKIVEKVIKIYSDVQKLKKVKKELVVLDLKKNIKELDIKAKEIVNKETKSIVDEIIKEHKTNIKEGREKELKTAIFKVVEKMIHMQDKGIIIETTPPRLEEPEILEDEETPENKKEREKAKKEHQSKLNKTRDITRVASNVAKIIKELTSTGKEILQISQYLDSKKEEETIQDE